MRLSECWWNADAEREVSEVTVADKLAEQEQQLRHTHGGMTTKNALTAQIVEVLEVTWRELARTLVRVLRVRSSAPSRIVCFEESDSRTRAMQGSGEKLCT